MQKAKRSQDTLRPEYSSSDFPGGMVRGKYAKRVAEGTNIVRLDPEIAAAFPTSKAVNEALGTVLKAARTARLAEGPSGQVADAGPRTKRGVSKTG